MTTSAETASPAELLSTMDFVWMAQRVEMFANPYRLQILATLLNESRTTRELHALLPITQSAVSQHLSVLRIANVVRSVRAGYTMRHTLLRDSKELVVLQRLFPEFAAAVAASEAGAPG